MIQILYHVLILYREQGEYFLCHPDRSNYRKNCRNMSVTFYMTFNLKFKTHFHSNMIELSICNPYKIYLANCLIV